ncbi:hypothetical protein V5O48_008118 [Marasmius crinis-equi]|uniref:Uncharacterized protein n=1 Tax=Marasmius crinis-equi TaxID=585013 RepID=A0ABR3FF02_9AGAR
MESSLSSFYSRNADFDFSGDSDYPSRETSDTSSLETGSVAPVEEVAAGVHMDKSMVNFLATGEGEPFCSVPSAEASSHLTNPVDTLEISVCKWIAATSQKLSVIQTQEFLDIFRSTFYHVEFPDQHSIRERLLRMADDVVDRTRSRIKVFAFMMNNAIRNDVLMEELGELFKLHDIPFDPVNSRLHCLRHTVYSAMKEIDAFGSQAGQPLEAQEESDFSVAMGQASRALTT